MRYRFGWTARLALLALLLGGCGKNTPMLISQSQEISVGQEVAQNVEQEYGEAVTDGPEYRRVQEIGGRLLRYANREVPYSLTLLNNSEVINAFAAPGGPLFVTTALCRLMTDDGELAFVIGHEISHVEAEHGRQAINQALMVNAAASLILDDRSQLQQLGASVVWTLYSQGYSRTNEREADALGLRMMDRAGYNPWRALDALGKLGGGNLSGPARYLSSHPSTPERIERLRDQIAREFPNQRER